MPKAGRYLEKSCWKQLAEQIWFWKEVSVNFRRSPPSSPFAHSAERTPKRPAGRRHPNVCPFPDNSPSPSLPITLGNANAASRVRPDANGSRFTVHGSRNWNIASCPSAMSACQIKRGNQRGKYECRPILRCLGRFTLGYTIPRSVVPSARVSRNEEPGLGLPMMDRAASRIFISLRRDAVSLFSSLFS